MLLKFNEKTSISREKDARHFRYLRKLSNNFMDSYKAGLRLNARFAICQPSPAFTAAHNFRVWSRFDLKE